MSMLTTLLWIEGGALTLVALVVLAIPSPNPALTRPLEEPHALVPISQTRRLLACMFLSSGLLLVVIAHGVTDPHVLVWVAWVRVGVSALLVGLQVIQLRSGYWKPPSLYALGAIFSLLGVAYAALALS
jgi:hypothetical protein